MGTKIFARCWKFFFINWKLCNEWCQIIGGGEINWKMNKLVHVITLITKMTVVSIVLVIFIFPLLFSYCYPLTDNCTFILSHLKTLKIHHEINNHILTVPDNFIQVGQRVSQPKHSFVFFLFFFTGWEILKHIFTKNKKSSR